MQTGNLLSRTDNRRNITETFGYDKLNRLCQIGTQQVKYADNGNVLEMPGMGVMGYDNAAKPYQVTAFTPIGNNVPTREQQITYNSFQCPDKITENGYSASFSYDAEGDRAEMTIRKGNDEVLTRQYIDARYEIDNSFTERFYLGGDAYDALAVCVNDFGVDSTYYILRDYLGNITHIINEDGTLRQELSYDAWGRLRNPDTHQLYAVGKEPKLLLDRGYTGHEYLPWFGLINMNARLYDPVLGRFLSPDPYVQMPDFTQNFNRYSYCLNNPLKYVDKDGEFWFLPAIIAFVVNYATTGITKGDWGLKNIGSSLVMSAVALVSYGVGMGITGALAKTAILSQSFIGGISAGVAGSVTGAMSSLMAGGNIGRGALIGFVSGLVGNALSGINMKSIWLEGVSNVAAGGLIGGATSLVSGGDFWSGFGTGAISATLGWALGKGADYVKDAVRRNEIQREVEKYLGLSKDVKEQQMSSPFAKAEQLEIPDMTAEKWNAIKNIYKRANAKYSVNFEKSQNFDLLQETYKFNRLHLRYNNTTKPNQASYTYHYDGTDIIMNPLRHIIFDSLYQWIVYKNK